MGLMAMNAFALVTSLADAGLKGSALFGVAGLATALLRRRSAAVRHAVWVFALGAQGVLIVTAIALSARGSIPRWAATTAEHPPLVGLTSSVGIVGLVVVLVGLLLVARVLAGSVRVRALMRRGTLLRDGAWLELAHRVGDELRIARPLMLVASSELEMPATTGVVYPRILLPAGLESWIPARRRMVLLHELAHVSRLDAATHLLVQLAAALAWWNPCVWLAVRRVRAERERACDDAVLRGGVTPSTYADDLLRMVRELRRGTRGLAPSAAALSMADAGDIESRLAAVLDARVDRAPLAPRALWSGGALAILLAVPLAAWSPPMRSDAPPVAPARVWAGFPPCSPGSSAEHTSASNEIKNDDTDQGVIEALHTERRLRRCLQLHLSGRIGLSTDERTVTTLEGRDAEVRVREITPTSRREVRVHHGSVGALAVDAWRDGQPEPVTDDVRAWLGDRLSATLPQMGLRTRERIAAWMRFGGVEPTLERIATIEGAAHQGPHLSEVLALATLSDHDRERVLAAARRLLGADEAAIYPFVTALPAEVVRAVRFDGAVDAIVSGMPSTFARREATDRVQRDRALARTP